VSHPQADAFREQARGCLPGSPLSAALLSSMADDLDAGGITADVVAGHEADRPGTVLPLRVLAALHRLVLEGRAPALSPYYPSVGGRAGLGDGLWTVAQATMRERLHEMRGLVDRTVQTNEPGRATMLAGGLLVIGERTGWPARLLEIGSSAGLALLVDRYGYVIGDRVLGDPHSALRFDEPWVGRPPAALDRPLRIAERRGCDPTPVDATTEQGRLTLMSYVWADWIERIERLRSALRVAATAPPPVDAARAAAWLAAQLGVPVPGVVTVVWHSVVWQYLERDEREEVSAALQRAAAMATPEAPLARLAFEPRRVEARTVWFELTLSLWPGAGEPELLARAPGHGLPVQWQPQSPDLRDAEPAGGGMPDYGAMPEGSGSREVGRRRA
jgi:hypothetical protein